MKTALQIAGLGLNPKFSMGRHSDKKKIDEILRISKKKRGRSLAKVETHYHDLYAASEKAEQIKNHVSNEYDTLLRTQSKLTAEIAQLRMEPNEVVQQHSHGPIFPFFAGSEIGRSSIR